MKNELFYKILDKELEEISRIEITGSLKNKFKQESQKKSYAFMIWFLQFYANIKNVADFITDGDGDHSCDIILDKPNANNEITYYLIQSKWNNLGNSSSELAKDEAKSFFFDAQSILKGDKEKTKNATFNKRYTELLEHVRQNGAVKVIFLTLKNSTSELDANIKSLEELIGGKISVEIFDINQLKKDFIARQYKRQIPPNPLERITNPEFEEVDIDIIRASDSIKIGSPFEAYVLTVKPSFVSNLITKYGFSIFDKNIRSPLISSGINDEIKNTLINNPSYFWYYNNGITAITKKIPKIGKMTETFKIQGIQIINGAQTAFSINRAMQEITTEQQQLIDTEAKVTLRLIKSGGREFDLKVTQFTNSQNPVGERDFHSGDEIQEKIQDYFFKTNIWYERRDGEFHNLESIKSNKIYVVPNLFMANAYLAFHLLDPCAVLDATFQRENEERDIIFTSHKDHPLGLYEKIFNKHLVFDDLFASFCVFDRLTDAPVFDLGSVFYSNGFHIMAVSKIVITKFLKSKYGNDINVSLMIIKTHQSKNDNEKMFINKALELASLVLKKKLNSKSRSRKEKASEYKEKALTNKSVFDDLLDDINKSSIDFKRLESTLD